MFVDARKLVPFASQRQRDHHRQMTKANRQRDEIEMTSAEVRFVEILTERVGEEIDIWLHATENRPWLIASLDVSDGRRVLRTFRVDFDGSTVVGGRSPASMNWDFGVSADEAAIDTQPPHGLPRTNGKPEVLAEVAAEWFLASTSAS